MTEQPILRSYDVVVIGAGGAGLRAALAAAEEGARVAVVSKSLMGKSQTVMGAALAAVLGEESGRDSWQAHYADTVRGAREVNQWRMAQLLAQEAPERVRELESWGMLFDRATDGDVRLGEGSGHRHARLARTDGHRTGLELLRTMQNRATGLGVDLYCECAIVELLTQDGRPGGRIAGALGCRRDSGEAIVFSAGAVVLATGGIGKAYAFTSNFQDATGDGHALANRAGADLVDMEFVQFHPTGMVAPESARGLLVAESIRNLGGVLLNAAGERFMFRYVPESYRAEIAETAEEADRWYADPSGRMPPELLPRDQVSRAMESEIQAGRGTPNGGVILDIASRRPADTIRKALPHMYRQFLDLADVDIGTRVMEVAPTCHYMMGGVRVDADTCAASVEGLFAAGETAGGLHGANRLNGNGISELIVFGRRAGQAAARLARDAGPAQVRTPCRSQRPTTKRGRRSRARPVKIRTSCSASCRRSCRAPPPSCAPSPASPKDCASSRRFQGAP
jgi:succinate dehydrogenase / fumarate reductase, flavoprotein subunit